MINVLKHFGIWILLQMFTMKLIIKLPFAEYCQSSYEYGYEYVMEDSDITLSKLVSLQLTDSTS